MLRHHLHDVHDGAAAGDPGDPRDAGYLLILLHVLGARAVRCGRHLGVQGEAVGKLPAVVWELLALHEAELLRRLPDAPSPYQRRRGRGG